MPPSQSSTLKTARTTRVAPSQQTIAMQTIAPEPCLPGTTGAVGIDVSKKNFHACYLAHAKARAQTGVFSSDADGHTKFLRWLDRVGARKSVHLCLEETGCYGRALGAFLHEAGHHVSIVNAALIKNFGRSLNLRTKTDAVDAKLIAPSSPNTPWSACLRAGHRWPRNTRHCEMPAAVADNSSP